MMTTRVMARPRSRPKARWNPVLRPTILGRPAPADLPNLDKGGAGGGPHSAKVSRIGDRGKAHPPTAIESTSRIEAADFPALWSRISALGDVGRVVAHHPMFKRTRPHASNPSRKPRSGPPAPRNAQPIGVLSRADRDPDQPGVRNRRRAPVRAPVTF